MQTLMKVEEVEELAKSMALSMCTNLVMHLELEIDRERAMAI